MPPRGVYKARQETRTRQADRSARPARESRSDQRQRDRQDAERRRQEEQARRAREADAKRKKAQADAIIAQRKAKAERIKKQVAQSSPQHSFAQKLGRSPVRDRRDIQSQPSGTSQASASTKKETIQLSKANKINNAVKSSTVSKMSPPLEKARATSKRGLTITGGKISTYSGGESGPKQKSLIYKDPNTGSTIATKEARTNIAKGGDYNIIASTASTKLGKGIPTPTTKERPN